MHLGGAGYAPRRGAFGAGWPNPPRKCQPNASLRLGEIKHSAVFSERQPETTGFVARSRAEVIGELF
jgi:hypothetical protein